VERKSPGNTDATCFFGHFDVGFGGFNVVGSGNGCCQWRTGVCGVESSDFGCVQVDEVVNRTPCTPDYSKGIVIP
jgi:hypothetical protein